MTALRLWLTRTQPGADRQAAALRAAGYQVVVAPVIDILPLPVDADAPAPPELVIFVSAHAVAAAAALLPRLAGAALFAVGAETARALAAQRLIARTPEPATSEGLLALPELAAAAVRGRCVWLVSGRGGRDLLATTLAERGARLERLCVYERRPVASPDVDPATVDVVVAGSGAGLETAWHHWRRRGGSPSVPVLVPSSRVAEQARQLGATRVIDCEGADLPAIRAALEALEASHD